MLLQNTSVFASMPITLTGGTLAGEFVFLGIRDQTFLNLDAAFDSKSSVPGGYTPGYAWFPPLKAGGMAAGGQIDISSTASASSGRNAEASSSISFSSSSAALVGVASIAASSSVSIGSSADATAVVFLSASGTISLSSNASASAAASAIASGTIGFTSSANMTIAPVNMEASGTISFSGVANPVGVASMQASGIISISSEAEVLAKAFMVASGSITVSGTAEQSANAFMVASSGGPEALSPEGLAAAVWRSLATTYNDSGTMGAKLNAASSAGDPWGATVPGSYPVGSAGWLIGQLALQNPDIATQLDDIWKRLGLDPSNPQISTEDFISSGPLVLEVTRDSSSTTLTRVI